jgi:hypothetical protein
LPEESFSIKDLGVTIAKMLGLQKNDIVEIQTSRTNPHEIKVVRHPAGQEQKPS